MFFSSMRIGTRRATDWPRTATRMFASAKGWHCRPLRLMIFGSCSVLLIGAGCDQVTSSKAPDRDVNGFTDLQRAARLGDMEAVSELLKYGADPNASDFGGVAPLHRAARDGEHELVTELVRYSAKLDAKTNTGWTPLHLAIRSGDYEMVNLLLGYGASLHIPLPDGKTPLIYASSRGDEPIVQAILKRANMPDALGKTLDLNAADSNGDTALHFAAREKNANIAISLITLGANPTIANNAKETPFFLAIKYRDVAMAGAMLENGATFLEQTPAGSLVTKFAQDAGDEEIIALLEHYTPHAPEG